VIASPGVFGSGDADHDAGVTIDTPCDTSLPFDACGQPDKILSSVIQNAS
jgi:hypothetical protein